MPNLSDFCEAGNIFGARGTSAVEYRKSTNKEQHADSTKKWSKKKHGRSKVECYNCHKFGHIRRFCPELGSKPVAVAAVQAEATRKQVQAEETRKQQKQSASSAHIVGTMDYFVSYEEFDTLKDPCRGFAQNMLTHAVDIGVAELVTKDRNGQLKKFTLDRVLYVPNARWNLFSAGVARDQGLREVQDPTTGTYNVYEDDILLLTAALQSNNVWSFRSYNSFTDDGGSGKFTSNAEIVNFTKMDGIADIRTWHARLGHTNAQYLKSMVDKSLVDGMMLKSRNLQLCETCQLAKQKRKKHMKSLE
ncbi:Integrase catalytic core protein [Phytophthora palmivora]|uniref:Integrase catalytic core protein n=1 Tax=Phytophthora palmivora TaxID=4796 RepID=A0A2P4XGM9_9STRA|nr:Integrase catalytic core protein [Phytophthora palmivora]